MVQQPVEVAFDLPGLLASVATLAVAMLAAGYGVKEYRNARETFVHNMRQEWAALSRSWAIVLMAESGADFHYADASPGTRAFVRSLEPALRGDPGTDGYSAALQLRQHVRPVTKFMSYAADSLVRGKWTMEEAYDVFGPDVARHHRTIRLLAHRTNRADWLEQALEFNTFDEQDCVFLLAILLRAEQCRRGDTYAHFAIELAEELRGDARPVLRATTRRIQRTRGRRLPRKLRGLLQNGRKPRVAAIYGVEQDPIVSPSQMLLLRRRFETERALRKRIERERRRSIAGSQR